MKLVDIKASVKHSVLVSLERAIYDAASQVEENELCERISAILVGIYSTDEAEASSAPENPTVKGN